MTNEFFAQGRIVWGHPCKLEQERDRFTNKPKVDDQGQPVMKCAFGLAVPKDYFFQHCDPVMKNVAGQAFPQGIPQDFSWKTKDGDTATSSNGKSYAEMEGRAGTVIITYSNTGFANTVHKMENGSYRQLDPSEIKCGDFVAVKTEVQYNGNRQGQNPGVYVNAKGIVHIGYGSEIVSQGADPSETFADFQPMQMPGMTAQPMMNTSAPVAPNMGGQPQQPQQMQQPQQPQQPQQMQQMPPPAHDFVQNAVQGTSQGNFTPSPAQNVGQLEGQTTNQQYDGTAQSATTYPSNGIPGMPQN